MKPPIIIPKRAAARTQANAAVEDDRQRGGGDEELLVPAPAPLVEQHADVGSCRVSRHGSPLESVRILR
jgi:hypothetical protein